MNQVLTRIRASLPPNRKLTPSGWESFNAVCCSHRGQSVDKRKRGGIRFDGEKVSIHCFNCNFKAGWSPGFSLSKNIRLFMSWIGISKEEIDLLGLVAFKLKDDNEVISERILDFSLTEKELPPNTKTITELIDSGCQDPNFIEAIEYLYSRGMDLDWYSWMWCNDMLHKDRLLIPFYFNGKIVGNTGRYFGKNPNKIKYLTDSQPGFVFNLDKQTYDRRYVIVTEGPLDAIAIDGVAILHNEPGEVQVSRINSLGKEVILVPDNDVPGIKMIDAAIENGWDVSLPEWGEDVKDVAKAVEKYGRIYTLYTILHYREHNKIKLSMLKKKIASNAKR